MLAAVYRPPVLRHVRARFRLPADEAEDLVQGFFAAALEKGWLERFDPARGRFRSYLLACVDGHVAHERRAAAALKRGGDVSLVPLELEGDDGSAVERPIADGTDLDAVFQREWARSVFTLALRALEVRCAGTARAVGLLAGLFFAYLVAMQPASTGKHYYWEIMLPGSLAGAIVGYATQRYGRRPGEVRG